MKKLVTLFTLAIAMVASADVASQNIVGYSTATTVAGFNTMTPAFTSVGFNTANIANITISDGGNGGIGWGGEQIIVLDEGGSPVANYTLWDPSADPNAVATTYYWGDDSWEAVDVAFTAGQGFLLSVGDAYSVTTAGQVSDDAVEFTSVSGFNTIGNSFAASLPIANITISDGGNGGIGWGGEQIIVLDEGGSPVANYTLWDPSADPNAVATNYYWGDDSWEAVDISFTLGQGFLLSVGDAYDVTVTSPYTL